MITDEDVYGMARRRPNIFGHLVTNIYCDIQFTCNNFEELYTRPHEDGGHQVVVSIHTSHFSNGFHRN
jgi:hypothetical protein